MVPVIGLPPRLWSRAEAWCHFLDYLYVCEADPIMVPFIGLPPRLWSRTQAWYHFSAKRKISSLPPRLWSRTQAFFYPSMEPPGKEGDAPGKGGDAPPYRFATGLHIYIYI